MRLTPLGRISFLKYCASILYRYRLELTRLLEAHELSPQILQVINAKLAAHGLLLKTGTVVDATLIAAPSSTKNKTGERDPEMH